MDAVVAPSFHKTLVQPSPTVKAEYKVGQTFKSGPKSNIGFS